MQPPKPKCWPSSPVRCSTDINQWHHNQQPPHKITSIERLNLPSNSATAISHRSWWNSKDSTRPVGPTALASEVVSDPLPVPVSSTAASGHSMCARSCVQLQCRCLSGMKNVCLDLLRCRCLPQYTVRLLIREELCGAPDL